MEQELQIASCLFGGPPVRDDLIKLGESQIGFMNIFARPLFEAVADILPAMRFAVEEIFTNKATWDEKMDTEREKRKRKKNPKLALGLFPNSFSADPTPSPFSGPPLKPPADAVPTTKLTNTDNSGRRGSNGSIQDVASTSRRLSQGAEKGSRRSSAAGLAGVRSSPSQENQSQSRRGSGDASLTAILVTQTSNSNDKSTKESSPHPATRSASPGKRKDTLTKTSPKSSTSKSPGERAKDGPRPLTAPSTAPRAQGKN